MHVSVNYAFIGSDNVFSIFQRQAVIWTHADLL